MDDTTSTRTTPEDIAIDMTRSLRVIRYGVVDKVITSPLFVKPESAALLDHDFQEVKASNDERLRAQVARHDKFLRVHAARALLT